MSRDFFCLKYVAKSHWTKAFLFLVIIISILFLNVFSISQKKSKHQYKSYINALRLSALATKFTTMKYSRLTKEQFEELHQEFSTFLATQTIDKAEWDTIKKDKPEVAEQ